MIQNRKRSVENLPSRKILGFLETQLTDYMPNLNKTLLRLLTGHPRKSDNRILAEIYLDVNPPNCTSNLNNYLVDFGSWAKGVLRSNSEYLDMLLDSNFQDRIFNPLNGRQKEMLRTYCSGVSYSEMGCRRSVSRQAVEHSIKRIKIKITRKKTILKLAGYDMEEIAHRFNGHFSELVLSSFPNCEYIILPKLAKNFDHLDLVGKPMALAERSQRKTVRQDTKSLDHLDLDTFKIILKNLSKDHLEWLIGFWEGDGSFFQGRFIFTQKDPRILQYIKDLLQLPDRVTKIQKHKIFGLSLPKKYSNILLETFQGNLLIESRIRQLGINQITKRLPTIPWITGFWDAEGCFCLRGGKFIGAQISQKDKEILVEVSNVIGGRLTGKNFPYLYLRKAEVQKFIPIYLEYSHNDQKKERLLTLIEFTKERKENASN